MKLAVLEGDYRDSPAGAQFCFIIVGAFPLRAPFRFVQLVAGRLLEAGSPRQKGARADPTEATGSVVKSAIGLIVPAIYRGKPVR
jgi:hypothetical protein